MAPLTQEIGRATVLARAGLRALALLRVEREESAWRARSKTRLRAPAAFLLHGRLGSRFALAA